MATALEVAQHLRGLKLDIVEHDQVTVVNSNTGEVMVNLSLMLDGYNLIWHAPSLTEEEAISMAVMMLLKEIHTVAYNDLMS